MYFENFRSNLKNLFEGRGFNLREFSDEVEIPDATLSRYLSGSRSPDLGYVIKIAKYFGVSVDWLLGLADDRYDSTPKEIQDIITNYIVATPDDKRVVQVVLQKYSREE